MRAAALALLFVAACGVKGAPRPNPVPYRPETLPGQSLPGKAPPASQPATGEP